jgi:hypothetical protein
MNKEQLASALYDEACKAQVRRMHPKESPNDADPRKVGPEFKDLHPVSQNHYVSMAVYVLDKFSVKS